MRAMRRKTAASKKKNNRIKRNQNVSKGKELSLDELLVAGECAMDALDVEKAIQMYSKAASLLRKGRTSTTGTREKDLIQVLEKLGESKVSMGDQNGARDDFLEALNLLDNEEETDKKSIDHFEARSNLLFYVGQLSMEHDALKAYQQGVESLESCLQMTKDQAISSEPMKDNIDESSSSEKLLQELRRKLSGAYSAVAELYLTDLCFEDNAEADCQSTLEKALQLKDVDGEPFVDTLQSMASLRLSQKPRRSEATAYILRVYEKIRLGSEALAALVGLSETEKGDEEDDKALELTEVEAVNKLPEFEFRCQTAKLLLECSALTEEEGGNRHQRQCVSAAISVLGSLLAQNDEVIEIWYLTGCAFLAKTPSIPEAADFYLKRAMEMLLDTKKSLEQESEFATVDEKQEIVEQLEENRVQIEDVQTKLDELSGLDSKEMEE